MTKKTKIWLKCAGIRAVKTMAQTAVALIPVAVSVTEVDWLVVIGTAALSGVVSLLTSVAGLPECKEV
ncbi:MAG: holin [Lachnospiraceae bacterium]|nr:holin [Lachnospiraceae bacterium]MDY5497859.1 holin [Anaerobutyricum sp.]